MSLNPHISPNTAVSPGVKTAAVADYGLPVLAAANNGFSIRFLQRLAAQQPCKNIFVSPYSVANGLQMIANGAAGQTLQEMQQVLGTADLSPEVLSGATKVANYLLNSCTATVELSVANSLWYRRGVEIKADFLDLSRKCYWPAPKALDYDNARAAEAEINRWAGDQTHGRITGIANGMIDPEYTDLILANAIYFKGKWQDPFDKSLTKERPFHPVCGEEKKLPTMHRSDRFQYREGTGYQAVRLPYEGGDLAMYVFLPERGSSPTKLLQILNGNKWRNVTMPGFSEREGLVELPKFKLENTFELVKPLQALGMKSAFTVQADFSGMFTDKHKISKVRQKTIVEVGEEGTEATAVTVVSDAPGDVVMMNPPPRPKPFEMVVDRPFLFTVVDARSEMILFMGVVNDL